MLRTLLIFDLSVLLIFFLCLARLSWMFFTFNSKDGESSNSYLKLKLIKTLIIFCIFIISAIILTALIITVIFSIRGSYYVYV